MREIEREEVMKRKKVHIDLSLLLVSSELHQNKDE